MSNKLTIIKVMGKNDAPPSSLDLQRWRAIFAENKITLKEAQDTGEIKSQELFFSENENYITFVKVGSDTYAPSTFDLEQWKKVFDQAKDDPDFKIFTHHDVEIEQIVMGKIIAIE